MKNYTEPMIELIQFAAQDILTDSNPLLGEEDELE